VVLHDDEDAEPYKLLDLEHEAFIEELIAKGWRKTVLISAFAVFFM